VQADAIFGIPEVCVARSNADHVRFRFSSFREEDQCRANGGGGFAAKRRILAKTASKLAQGRKLRQN
jgi:hypothetical protein